MSQFQKLFSACGRLKHEEFDTCMRCDKQMLKIQSEARITE